MKMLHDYHMHSRFSEDGSSSLEEMCRQAIKLGIPETGFCEHWDVGPFELKPRFFQPEPWFKELNRLRELFKGQLILRAGLEIAEPHLYPGPATELIRNFPFDYVIGSVHWVGTHFMFDEQYFRQNTADEVYSAYFAELERMVTTAELDIVAHFDIPTRTAIPILGYEPTRYEEQIRKILDIIIKRGLALDVNSAGKRKPAGNLMPDPLILKWYAEMGGKRVTLGSDAHQVSQVGLYLEEAMAAIRAAGLSHLAQFEQRAVRLIPL